MSAEDEIEWLAIKGAGRGLYHWGEDEPNKGTGYIARAESADAALGVLKALREAGYEITLALPTREEPGERDTTR